MSSIDIVSESLKLAKLILKGAFSEEERKKAQELVEKLTDELRRYIDLSNSQTKIIEKLIEENKKLKEKKI